MNKKVHFNELISLIETKIQNKPVMFTTDTLDKETVPSNYFTYDVSLDEDIFEYDFLGKDLQPNIYAYVIALVPLKLDDNDVYRLKKSDLKMGKSQDYTSVREFIRKHG